MTTTSPFPWGGGAPPARLPGWPKPEFRIALAGPAVTLAIAVMRYAGLRLAHVSLAFNAIEQTPLLVRVLYLNASLLGVNLIPAFPMDGGRVLRSLPARRCGEGRGRRPAAHRDPG